MAGPDYGCRLSNFQRVVHRLHSVFSRVIAERSAILRRGGQSMKLSVVSRAASLRNIGVVVWAFVAVAVATPGWATFVTFESGQVRPLALSPDGNRLYAVNTPDSRQEIFTVDA